jgi:catechol 2,3-dioxygenase-like lactoylglutathione lyase family enzyme
MIYEHLGITVSDLERSIRFYMDVFDFELMRKTTISAYLHPICSNWCKAILQRK